MASKIFISPIQNEYCTHKVIGISVISSKAKKFMNLVCVIYVTLLTKLFVVSWEPPAIAQWIRLHQPFCGPAFESQTYISSTLF